MVPVRIHRHANFWFGLTLVVTLLTVTAHLSKMAHFLRFLSFDVRQDIFPSLLQLCIVLLILMTIRLVLLRIHQRRDLAGLLRLFATRGILGSFIDIARIPAIRFLLWGLLIIAIVLVPLSRKSFFVENAELVMFGSEPTNLAEYKDTPVRILWMFTKGQGLPARLERLLKVCRDMKAAGAKAVLVESPAAWWATEQEGEAMREIQQTGIAIVGFRADDSPPGDPWYRSTLIAPTPEYADSLHLAKAVISMRVFPTAVRLEGRTLSLLAPYRYISGFGSHDTVPDVVVEVLRKFRDYPSTLKPVVAPTSVEFGDYSIPTTSDGVAVFTSNWGRGALSFGANDHWSTARFGYQSYRGGDTTTYENLDRFSSEVKDMIVVVSAYDALDTRFPAWGGIPYYRGVLSQILQRSVTRYVDRFALPGTIFAVLISALLTFFLRIRIAVPTMLGLLFLTLGIGIASFQLSNIILEVIYPCIAICMCALVLPLVKISAEAYASRQIK